MRFVLGMLVILFNLADNATTFLCLHRPIPGFTVVEVNPFARWLFNSVGLTEGLLIEMIITLAAVGFLVFSKRLSPQIKLIVLTVLIVLPAWAVVNNLNVMKAIGVAL
jgi:hypothetical protein